MALLYLFLFQYIPCCSSVTQGMTVGLNILESVAIRQRKPHNPTVISFDALPACDRKPVGDSTLIRRALTAERDRKKQAAAARLRTRRLLLFRQQTPQYSIAAISLQVARKSLCQHSIARCILYTVHNTQTLAGQRPIPSVPGTINLAPRPLQGAAT